MCVKSNQEYCVGNPRAYRTVGTLLNGSYQAPDFADINGDGRSDLITAHTTNNSIMIFYNQGSGRDGLPVFEAAASVIVPSKENIRALHAVFPQTGTSCVGCPHLPRTCKLMVNIVGEGNICRNIGLILHYSPARSSEALTAGVLAWRCIAEGEAPLPPYLLVSMDLKADGDLIIPMLDNVGTLTQPEFVWR